MYPRLKKTLFLIFILSFAVFNITFAQGEQELNLRMSRDFGYSSGMGKIQGTFSMKITGPEDLARVVFYVDDQVLAEDIEPPFKVQFHTDSFQMGIHTLYARGIGSDGREMHSNEIRVEFVSAEEGWQAGLRIAGPILGIAFGAILISVVFMFITAKTQQNLPLGTPRKYGIAGGAICPKCKRPFSRHLLAPNLGVGKLERCPFCGKWSVVRARSMGELRSAERIELESMTDSGKERPMSEAEKLSAELEDSRFQDL